jgi:hypothetical protein
MADLVKLDPNSSQSTLGVNVDAKPAEVMKASQAPAGASGASGSSVPTVGTNEADQWATWDPNQWWTNWSVPAKPQPTWELWFDWINQLQSLVPAVHQAGQDWQTLASQFDNALQTVRTMRGELTSWTGPSAQTMSQSLDQLESSISTKADSIRDNPMKLQDLAQAITDAVGPMQSLDAQYQQVLTNDQECRQVALQGQPIMMNLAQKLLQTGTDIENSAQSSNLAPQPTPPQQAASTSGAQGPQNQLAQVAGSNGQTDPGNVSTGSQIAVAVAPSVAGPSGLADPGTVQTAQQQAVAHVPGVAVGQGQSTVAGGIPAQSTGHVAATPTLAGASAGTVAPSVTPLATNAPMPSAPAMQPTMGTPFMAAPMSAPSSSVPRNDEHTDVAILPFAVPIATGGAAEETSGAVAVPIDLLGRHRGAGSTTNATAGVIRPDAEDDEEAPLGLGVLATRPQQA